MTNLDASPYVGRLALCRVRHGTIRRGQAVAWCRADGSIERAQVAELYVTDALDRVEAEEAAAGEIIALAGIAEVTIGETLADPDDPRPLPVITVDEPSLSVTIGVNTSPLAGKEGDKLTARQIRARLDQELVGNVWLRVRDSDRPEVWEVQGRREPSGDPDRADRRDGSSSPSASPRQSRARSTARSRAGGEPGHRLPEDYVGVVTQLIACARGTWRT